LRRIFILLCLFGSYSAISQSHIDTLSRAQELVKNNKLQEAVTLLETYRPVNPDQYALQLQAQVYFWLNEIDRSVALYRTGRKLFPGFLPLHLDLARVLFQSGKYKEAESELRSYLASDPDNAEAKINLAYLELWKGNVNVARKQALVLSSLYPENMDARNLSNHINNSYSPLVDLNYDQLSDDQPMKAFQHSIQVSVPSSSLFSPHFKTDYSRFNPKNLNSTLWIRGGNTFRSGYSRTTISLEGGYFRNNNNQGDFTGLIAIGQKLSSDLRLTASTSRIPYQYTLASLERPFLYKLHSAALELDGKNLIGKAGLEVQQFEDNNAVSTLYAWGLFPLVRKQAISLNAGYGISFANTTSSRLKPTLSINDIINNQPVNSQVQGVYDPYFTPQNQLVNSLLISSGIRVSKHSSFSVKGSFGVLASADNPVLILEKRNNSYFLSRSFYRQQYNPIEFDAALDLYLGNGFSFITKYNYSNLFFYTRHIGGVSIRYRFTYEN
jgi:tetratricopeptide (TPR) repeat protein